MNVGAAKELARQWVATEATALPGFQGAFFHGSINWLPDHADLPATSDLDVMVVLTPPAPPVKPGKFMYRGVMLEVSYLTIDQLPSADAILGQYHLAGSFAHPSIILDPTGALTALQAAVSRGYARREWVEQRCRHARDRMLGNLDSIRATDPFPDQVTAWLFGTGVATHVLLVAGLRNPTVRQRYLAVRHLLADYGQLDFYEPLLALLGCAAMTQPRAVEHLAALTEAFDAAKEVVTTPFFFAADISDQGRPVAIGGSRDLIERGDHREAVFWLVATYARCMQVFAADAPELTARFEPGFRRLSADLGITAFADLERRGDDVRAFLPRLWDRAERIMAANPAIDG